MIAKILCFLLGCLTTILGTALILQRIKNDSLLNQRKPKRLSPSALKTWGGCSLQAKYAYIDNLPQPTGSAAWFGSAVHSALEFYHLGKTEEECIKEFHRYFDSQEPDYWNRRTTYTGYKDIGPRMISEYIAQDQWNNDVTLSTEFRFMVPFGDHQLSGIVDLLSVTADDSELKIIDFKTGAKPNMDNLHLNLQFTVYLYASHQEEFWCGYPGEEEKYTGLPNGKELFEKYKDTPRSSIWYDLKKNQPIKVGDRSLVDYGRLYRIVEQIERAVEYEVFVPSVSADTCTFCAYTDRCPVYIDAAESPVAFPGV